MHVFLTGALQVGKSTLVRRVAAAAAVPVGGFETRFVGGRENPARMLCIGAPDGRGDVVVARFSAGKPLPEPAAFDREGCRLLADARASAGLILMDECGRLERDALAFQQAVLGALDGGIPVLGVVRQDAGGWTEAIWRHPGVRVIVVTEENRDALAAELALWASQACGRGR